MANFLDPVRLGGSHALLVPLAHEHHDDLAEAVRDGELWNLWYTIVPSPQDVEADIDRRLALQAKGMALPFAVIATASGKAVGVTSYLNIDGQNRRVEIGGTWYRSSLQRTALNTECKLLLLSHAFEAKDCIAVEFRTHFMNHQSRRGIERLGAKLDGILRNHMIMANGTLRDTCVYSIVATEWPTVKANLTWHLARPRALPTASPSAP
ncbi:MAG TPA: GNAT family protein [Stellaceae bacterium]|nr:GNAT family protein [Stellaceae bacterium]